MKHRRERAPRIVDALLVGLSLALALAASSFALLGPTGRYEEGRAGAVPEGASVELREPPVVERGSTSLLGQIRSGEEDAAVLVALVVPVVIALLPLALLRTRLEPAARAVAAFLLLAFVVVAGFSIGLLYLPSAVAMALAAAQASRG